jgi:hypothetical protein
MIYNKRYTRRALAQEVNRRSVNTKSRVSTPFPDRLKLCLRQATGQAKTKQNDWQYYSHPEVLLNQNDHTRVKTRHSSYFTRFCDIYFDRRFVLFGKRVYTSVL